MPTKPNFELRIELTAVLPLLQKAGLVTRARGLEQGISGTGAVSTDSRRITSGDLFLAYRGVTGDGHDHLASAASAGARLFVVESLDRVPENVPAIEVSSGRAAWAHLAAEATGHPERHLRFFGVTGTNGKTSTVWIFRQILRHLPENPLDSCAIGTLGAYLGDTHLPTAHTTPDPPVFFGILREAVARGIKICAMEVSSHAIKQEKLGPVRFEGVAFTSFSRDHLDFHPTMEDYWETKARLFHELALPGARMALSEGLPQCPAPKGARDLWVYGADPIARAEAWDAPNTMALEISQATLVQSCLTLTFGERDKTPLASQVALEIPYLGRHGMENFAAAYILASKACGTWPKSFAGVLAPVPGRLERVPGPTDGPDVVVDYAHTPDALEKTLAVLKPLTKGRLAVVFGCGGDRDKGKRPEMGAVAERMADAVFVTSDNPRSEEPEAILCDIKAGMSRPAEFIVDRAEAIERAIKTAKAGDTVLIAGKGHETYQIIGKEKLPFDDLLVAADALRRNF